MTVVHLGAGAARKRPDSRTHRLLLSAEELPGLGELGGLHRPRGSTTGQPGGHRDVPGWVAATLARFAAAELVVVTRIHHGDLLHRYGLHAVRGESVAGIVIGGAGDSGDRDLELSSAPAARLGFELARLVPDLPGRSAAAGRSTAAGRPRATRLPPDLLVALSRSATTTEPLVGLVAGMTGSLQVVLHSCSWPAVAQLLWVSTAAGWVALRPEERDGESLIELCPVDVRDLGPELARLLAGVSV